MRVDAGPVAEVDRRRGVAVLAGRRIAEEIVRAEAVAVVVQERVLRGVILVFGECPAAVAEPVCGVYADQFRGVLKSHAQVSAIAQPAEQFRDEILAVAHPHAEFIHLARPGAHEAFFGRIGARDHEPPWPVLGRLAEPFHERAGIAGADDDDNGLLARGIARGALRQIAFKPLQPAAQVGGRHDVVIGVDAVVENVELAGPPMVDEHDVERRRGAGHAFGGPFRNAVPDSALVQRLVRPPRRKSRVEPHNVFLREAGAQQVFVDLVHGRAVMADACFRAHLAGHQDGVTGARRHLESARPGPPRRGEAGGLIAGEPRACLVDARISRDIVQRKTAVSRDFGIEVG